MKIAIAFLTPIAIFAISYAGYIQARYEKIVADKDSTLDLAEITAEELRVEIRRLREVEKECKAFVVARDTSLRAPSREATRKACETQTALCTALALDAIESTQVTE